jgi:small neutral amino acid transporter SnatA (MarC family)
MKGSAITNIDRRTLLSGAAAASALGAALLLAIGVGSRVGSRAQATVTRFMGLIVASMGMQFVLTGWKAFFNL